MSIRGVSNRFDNLVLIGALLGLCAHGCGSVNAEPRTNAVAASDGTQRSCQLVKRAARTWVGFGEGVGMENLEVAARASTAIVRALDSVLCALVNHSAESEALRAESATLLAQAANGGHFEVSSLTLRDARGLSARVEIRSVTHNAPSDEPGWDAVVTSDGAAWKVISWSRASAE